MTAAMVDVLFYVQHLLGIGHLKRAALIARALDRAGLRVVLVSGGVPVPGLEIGGADLVQLPPLKSRDAAFSVLVDQDGRAVDDAWKARRRDLLLDVYRRTRPRVLLTEQFPFGRRLLRFELLPLLAEAAASRPRPAVVASVRDIINPPGSAEKSQWMLDMVRNHYDRVLVHGDPDLVRLTHSFPAADTIADRLIYTGYVAAPAATAGPGAGDGEVLVSAGGGAVAAPLVRAAFEARPLGPLATAPWRILIGGNLPDEAFTALRQAAPPGVVVERVRPDFRALLARCRLSVSQAGYNTMMDVLAARAPAVIVPFVGAGEQEQSLRAALLAGRGLVTVVDERDLSGATLAAGIARALDAPGPRPRETGIDMNGTARTAEIVVRMVAERMATSAEAPR